MKNIKHLLFLSILCSIVLFTNCGDSDDPEPTSNNITNDNSETDDNSGTNDNTSTIISGCTDPLSLTYDPNATEEDGSCLYNAIGTWEIITFLVGNIDICADYEYKYWYIYEDGSHRVWGKLTDGTFYNGWSTYTITGQNNSTLLDTNPATGASDSWTIIEVDSDYLKMTSTLNGESVIVEAQKINSDNLISGCTDPNAANFNSSTTYDDGSCQYNAPGYFVITSFMLNDADVLAAYEFLYYDFYADGTTELWGKTIEGEEIIIPGTYLSNPDDGTLILTNTETGVSVVYNVLAVDAIFLEISAPVDGDVYHITMVRI